MRLPDTSLKPATPANYPAVERLLGAAAEILSERYFNASDTVHVSLMEVAAGRLQFEEHGRFLFLPVEGSLAAANPPGPCRASLQLHYLRQGSDDGTAVVVSLLFHPDFLAQWPAEALSSAPAFRRDLSTEHQLSLCNASEVLLDELVATAAVDGLLALLRRAEIASALLRRALEAVAAPFTACAVPACRFLAYDSEREKIFLARDILEAGSERPLTIKELSRKVAMNECYLKKGFKALTGKTIYDFQHERRIARAQAMLQEDGRTVSDVADALGFSSISHFSTAFKKATGLKPCELLR